MKNFLKKTLAMLLCLATIVSFAAILSSCTGKKDKEDEKMTVIVDGGASSYTIIRAENASKEFVNMAVELRLAIVEKTGCEIDMGTDWVKREEDIDPNAKEILVGNTNRPETKEVVDSLEPNNWAVVNKGNKIVICANNDALLSLAIQWFIDNCVNETDKTVKIAEKLVKVDGFGGELPISLGGVSDYQIVYPKDNKLLEYYAGLIQRETKLNGRSISVVSDDKAEKTNEIVVGTTNRGSAPSFTENYEYSITVDEGKVFINASDEDTLYYAVNYYIEYGMTISDTVVSTPANYDHKGKLQNFYNARWDLNLPYIEEGIIAKVYDIGAGLDSDKTVAALSESYMHLVSNAEYSAFENYAKKLESFGFKKTYTSKNENNDLWGFSLGAAYAYVHYAPSQKYIRVIWDQSSNCKISDFEYTEQQSGTTTFYQYSLDYTNAQLCYSERTINCGMLYIVKLQDNSLILVDGGHTAQASDKSLKGIYDFLYEITGTPSKESLNIRFWYFTHPDGDHNELSYLFLNYIKDNGLKIPNVDTLGFNYPSERANDKLSKTDGSYNMLETMKSYYPNVNYIKLHTDMIFNIGEVKFEVLSTVENLVEKTGTINAAFDTNDTCTVVRLWMGGKSIMLAGDSGNNTSVQDFYLPLHSSSHFKSDILQISHHGYNYLSLLYKYCKAEYAAISNDVNNVGRHSAYTTLVGKDNVFYAGNFTTAFEIKDGQITIKKIPRYDNPTGSLDGIEY